MKYRIVLLLILGAVACSAAPRYESFVFAPNGTNWAAAYTLTSRFQGYVDEVYVEVPSASTAIVSVVSTPAVSSNLTPTVLYTNAAVVANSAARPRVFQTDKTGTTITNLSVSERFLCAGDPITVSVRQVSKVTNCVYRVYLKIDD